MKRPFACLACVAVMMGLLMAVYTRAEDKAAKSQGSIFEKQKLVAWCIVPFDSKMRGPAARAEMLVKLGIKRVAYDWRAKDIPTFEEEILQYKKHDLEYFAFWDWHDSMAPLIKKHGIKPQVWIIARSPAEGTQQEKIAASAQSIMHLVETTKELGLKLGIYNHGGWSGEPENMVAVCKYLHEKHDADHVGLVYNFHHGHDHIDRFANALKTMKPYLHCLNLNGMNAGAQPKILPIGDGKFETQMMKTVQASGYTGPIGILDHRSDTDTEIALRANLKGMKKVLAEIGDQRALKSYE